MLRLPKAVSILLIIVISIILCSVLGISQHRSSKELAGKNCSASCHGHTQQSALLEEQEADKQKDKPTLPILGDWRSAPLILSLLYMMPTGYFLIRHFKPKTLLTTRLRF